MSLAGNRPGEERLAGSRRAGEKYTMRHPPAQAPVTLGRSKEVDDLRELRLGLVDAGHVGERHADRLRVDPARL